ncbi:MAG: hypothetical protein JW700_00345 [Candidatus Aenigmarchaeota archaeon]|nr:hypothetical protein [Candidatus Aenigmarchaeota archaeon]
MRGVHPILSHSIMLIIGLGAMAMIIASVSSTLSDTERDLLDSQMEFVTETMRSDMLKIYSTMQGNGNFSGMFLLRLPEKIGDQRYTMLLSNSTIKIMLPFENQMLEFERPVDINVSMSGEKMMPASLFVTKIGDTITMDLV